MPAPVANRTRAAFITTNRAQALEAGSDSPMAQPALGKLARFKTPEERVAAWRNVIDVAVETCGTFKFNQEDAYEYGSMD